MREKRKGIKVSPEEEDLGKGNLFATGLVAGGALAGVIVAFLSAFESTNAGLQKVNAEHAIADSIGEQGYKWLGVAFFTIMSYTLYRVAIGRNKK